MERAYKIAHISVTTKRSTFKLRNRHYPIVAYADHLICIFINIYENIKACDLRMWVYLQNQ